MYRITIEIFFAVNILITRNEVEQASSVWFRVRVTFYARGFLH